MDSFTHSFTHSHERSAAQSHVPLKLQGYRASDICKKKEELALVASRVLPAIMDLLYNIDPEWLGQVRQVTREIYMAVLFYPERNMYVSSTW